VLEEEIKNFFHKFFCKKCLKLLERNLHQKEGNQMELYFYFFIHKKIHQKLKITQNILDFFNKFIFLLATFHKEMFSRTVNSNFQVFFQVRRWYLSIKKEHKEIFLLFMFQKEKNKHENKGKFEKIYIKESNSY
jgi:hypothetical protein